MIETNPFRSDYKVRYLNTGIAEFYKKDSLKYVAKDLSYDEAENACMVWAMCDDKIKNIVTRIRRLKK